MMTDDVDPWNEGGPADWPSYSELQAASAERMIEPYRQRLERMVDELPRPLRWWVRRRAKAAGQRSRRTP